MLLHSSPSFSACCCPGVNIWPLQPGLFPWPHWQGHLGTLRTGAGALPYSWPTKGSLVPIFTKPGPFLGLFSPRLSLGLAAVGPSCQNDPVIRETMGQKGRRTSVSFIEENFTCWCSVWDRVGEHGPLTSHKQPRSMDRGRLGASHHHNTLLFAFSECISIHTVHAL